MYRRLFFPVRASRSALLCPLVCQSTSKGSDKDNDVPHRVSRRRRVAPTDDDVAELHAEELNTQPVPPPLASVAVEPMRFGGMGNFRVIFEEEEEGGALEEDNNERSEETQKHTKSPLNSEDETAHVAEGHNNRMEREAVGDDATHVSFASTPLPPLPHGEEAMILERQSYARDCSIEEFVVMVIAYLRATTNVRLVSATEEHVFFPVLMDRLTELHVEQMLDIVECHWARSTLVRYGTQLKDMMRDRIAEIASRAAKRTLTRASNSSEAESAEEVDDGDVYAHETDQKVASDVVLLNAATEMSPAVVLRCIVVMGMSAGRRKRDLQFFQAMGIFFAHHINKYKDPHDLQRVLTAFARAKIVPPKGFMALLGRRFAVLSKRTPMSALPSYRAFVNFYKMGYDQMNPFRFLADRIFDSIDANIKAETKRRRLAQLQRQSLSDNKEEAQTNGKEVPNGDDDVHTTQRSAAPQVGGSETMPDSSIETGDALLEREVIASFQARERFRRLTELRPSMFTKLLFVLARLGAPHQQYLRPAIAPLILPTLAHFPPPSRTRLLRAMRMFRTTDRELLEPVIDALADQHASTSPSDALEILRLVSSDAAPAPTNFARLVSLCEELFANRPARPNDMCAVAATLLHIQRKEDIPLESLDPLTQLMERFAARFIVLIRLHVVSLTHVDVFCDVCQQQQHPDESGSIATLAKLRRQMSESDMEYESELDIDVRETFHRIVAVNEYNTHGQYRPTPGVMQVDLRQALTEVTAFDVLEASDLFAKAFPEAMRPTVERLLSRSVIAKLGDTGEEVITTEHTMVLRPPRDMLLAKTDLVKFVTLLQETPLRRVRESPVVWRFVEEKAKRLKLEEILQDAQQRASQVTTAF